MAIKKLGKKGVFLTFISIAIIAAIIIIFTPSNINLEKDIPVIKTRVSNVNEYVLDLENVYLERTLQATGRKTLIGLINYVRDNGFLADIVEFENAFSETLLTGEYNGNPIDGMAGNTYNDWLNSIKTTADSTFNVVTGFTVNNINVQQISPWFVDVEADITFSVTSETASWNKNVIIRTKVPIENFNDPYYLFNTGGSYVNKIRQSGTKFEEWNVNEVNNFITDGNYTHFENSNAPSFLQRFYNDLSSSSCCGIESLVDQNNPTITDKDVSYVDYLYWSTTPTCPSSTLYTVIGTTGHFKIDFGHLVLYNLVSEGSLKCPPP